MGLMQEEDRRSGSVTHLGSWVHSNIVFVFWNKRDPPFTSNANSTTTVLLWPSSQIIYFWLST